MNKNIKIDKSNKHIIQAQENQRRFAGEGGICSDYWMTHHNPIFLPNKRGKKKY